MLGCLRAGLALAVLAWLGAVRPAAAADYRYVTIPFPQRNGVVAQLYALEVVPEDAARHPLAVISHGAPRDGADAARMAPGQYQSVAKWFTEHGFAVVVPMRRGYGQTGGKVQESYGSCSTPDYGWAGQTTANDIEAVVRHMRGESFVDPQRIVLVGHSAGGWGSVALASRNPPGVAAVISFAGGRGSYAPDRVCSDGLEVNVAARFGGTARVPSLWIYSANDHFFAPALAHAMFDAFHGAGAPAEFFAAPACGDDGHQLITRCPGEWHDVVAAFLQRTVGAK